MSVTDRHRIAAREICGHPAFHDWDSTEWIAEILARHFPDEPLRQAAENYANMLREHGTNGRPTLIAFAIFQEVALNTKGA